MNHDNEKAVYLNNTGGNGNDRSLNKNFRRQPDNIESNLTVSELVKMPFKEVIQILYRAGFEDKDNGHQYKVNDRNNNGSRRWNDDRDIDYRGKNDHNFRGDRDHRGRGRGDFKRGGGRDQGRDRGDRGGFHDGGRDSKFEHNKNNGWPNGNSEYNTNKNNQLESWGMQKKSLSPQKIDKKNWWDVSSVEKPIQD